MTQKIEYFPSSDMIWQIFHTCEKNVWVYLFIPDISAIYIRIIIRKLQTNIGAFSKDLGSY